jgi:hypothetical protein
MLRRLLLVVVALLAATAGAHEMSMAEMELREISCGEFLWQWTASGNRPASEDLAPAWPGGCRADEVSVRCGEAGMTGSLSIEGVGKRYSAAMSRRSSAEGCGLCLAPRPLSASFERRSSPRWP